MRTVGQILKEEREKKLFTLDEVEKATKIRKELLIALEADNTAKLPPATFVQGFIKNYGKFLGLDVHKLLAIYRRDSDRKLQPKVLESLSNPMQKRRFSFTPTKMLSGLVIGLILVFFGYLWFEYRFLAGAPFIEVIQPAERELVETEFVEVRGKTDPEAKVSINSQQVQVDFAGNFSEKIKLTESANTITITSTSKSGKEAKIERTVFLKR